MGDLGYFLRRVAGYLIDYAIIAAYALGLAGVVIATGLEAPGTKLGGYLLSFATLTGPVVIVFAALEALWGVSPGKAIVGLRVMYRDQTPGFGRALARNVLKFLPWEIAHIGIWMTPGQPFVVPPSMISLIVMNAALALVGTQAALIAVTGRGVHDRLPGLRVVRVQTRLQMHG